MANVTPVYKKAMDDRNVIISLSAYCETHQSCLQAKGVFTSRYLNNLKE